MIFICLLIFLSVCVDTKFHGAKVGLKLTVWQGCLSFRSSHSRSPSVQGKSGAFGFNTMRTSTEVSHCFPGLL